MEPRNEEIADQIEEVRSGIEQTGAQILETIMEETKLPEHVQKVALISLSLFAMETEDVGMDDMESFLTGWVEGWKAANYK